MSKTGYWMREETEDCNHREHRDHGEEKNRRRATSAMISLSGQLTQGGDVEEANYETCEKTTSL
jgi:hypothetical protein